MAPTNDTSGKIYSATYSNVPVYELNVASNHVMRRRSDDWINATHILKVADYDKPARTRILEREVQKGIHEKVQGGYGKYQGTWIPLDVGRELASKNGVLEVLRPIFEFVPGDRSPPPAPKHATAVSAKPRVPRQPAPPRRQPVQMNQEYYDAMDTSMRDDETPDNLTVVSESAYDDYDPSSYTNSRHNNKRRRVEDPMSQQDKEHQLWADELLDYFLLQDNPLDAPVSAPAPPATANLDRPIDDKGHTALHWAAAMGDMEVVKDLIRRGASVDSQSGNGETPLMRAVLFTNCFDRANMDRLAGLLIRTVNIQEWTDGGTVFHHVAKSTFKKSKYSCARYYMDCLLNKMAEILPSDGVEGILNVQDKNGDTAITIAARFGARKCVRSLLGRNAAVDLPNHAGETADQLIVQLNARRQERVAAAGNGRQLSSSPFQGDGMNHSHRSIRGGPVQPPHLNGNGMAIDPLLPTGFTSSLNGSSAAMNGSNDRHADIYHSAPALSITAQIFPTLLSKARTLASSIDAEIAEKDAEVAEAERVAELRRGELEGLRRQAEELRVREAEGAANGGESGVGEEGEGAMERELEVLERECRELEAEERSKELHDLYQSIKSDRSRDGGADDEMSSTSSSSAEELLQLRFSSARHLISLHKERVELIRTIVNHLGAAGMGEKQGLYKRLITGALGVREEDVEGLLPEIVGELEDGVGMGEGMVM